MAAVTAPLGSSGIVRSPRRVIIASSLGTVFEWYDFFLPDTHGDPLETSVGPIGTRDTAPI